ncbi:late competence development ComFB family protein [Nostoc sp. UHCC 0302]|uniref:late competence development ComFB family protein n=1 Tax=Nostoc sp. UHCC 0302 TaxID=3134896 RepID=UPI00311CAC07
MSKTLVNLTMPIVLQGIEDVLEKYPHHPYQKFFANSDFRQGLIAYILNRIPSHYISVEVEEKEDLFHSSYFHNCLEQAMRIETIVHQGIKQILYEKTEELSRYIPEVTDPSRVPSNWFG